MDDELSNWCSCTDPYQINEYLYDIIDGFQSDRCIAVTARKCLERIIRSIFWMSQEDLNSYDTLEEKIRKIRRNRRIYTNKSFIRDCHSLRQFGNLDAHDSDTLVYNSDVIEPLAESPSVINNVLSSLLAFFVSVK